MKISQFALTLALTALFSTAAFADGFGNPTFVTPSQIHTIISTHTHGGAWPNGDYTTSETISVTPPVYSDENGDPANYVVEVHKIVRRNLKPSSFTGWNAGVDFGVLTFDNVNSSYASTRSLFTDLGYSVNVGYGYKFANNLYLGSSIEVGSTTGVTCYNAYKDIQNFTTAADVRAGYVFSGTTLAYGRLGYAETDIQEKNVVTSTNDYALFAGLRTGLGVEHFVGPNFAVRTEALYTDYETRNVGGHVVDPSNLALRVGTSYYFN